MNRLLTASACGVLTLLSTPQLADAQSEWSFRDRLVRPTARRSAAFQLDAARGELVLFGGYETTVSAGTMLGDTWILNALGWQPRASGTVPARGFAASCYDRRRSRVVLFGGTDSSFQPLDDTWEWDGSTWRRNLTLGSAPPKTSRSAMVYVDHLGVCILFGGLVSDGTGFDRVSNSTWSFDGMAWRRVNRGASSPAPRRDHHLAYDASRQRIVLFGGEGAGGIARDDTWEWDGQRWRELQPSTRPPARRNAAFTYDATAGGCTLFGGWTFPERFGDTWRFDGLDWTQITSPSAPSARRGAVVSSSVDGSGLVLFGGQEVFRDRNDGWLFGPGLGSYAPFGDGCSGGGIAPRLRAVDGPPRIGHAFQLRLEGIELESAACLATGISRHRWGPRLLPYDLTHLGMPGCQLEVAPMTIDMMRRRHTKSFLAFWSTQVPNVPALAGVSVYQQAFVIDPRVPNSAGAVASSGAVLRLGS